jgi:hypothetical protein
MQQPIACVLTLELWAGLQSTIFFALRRWSGASIQKQFRQCDVDGPWYQTLHTARRCRSVISTSLMYASPIDR